MAGFLAGAAVPLLKALGATATAGGAAMGVNWALGLPKELEKGVYTQGPNPDGTYSSSNPLVKLLVDEENTGKMDALYREYQQRNDPAVRQRIQQLGGDTSAPNSYFGGRKGQLLGALAGVTGGKISSDVLQAIAGGM